MTRMTGPDCVVMCNLINTHTHTHTHTHTLYSNKLLGGILVCMHVCMYGHTYNKSIDQPGKVANPARGQLDRERKLIFPCPRSRLRIWFCETGSAVPSRVRRRDTLSAKRYGSQQATSWWHLLLKPKRIRNRGKIFVRHNHRTQMLPLRPWGSELQRLFTVFGAASIP